MLKTVNVQSGPIHFLLGGRTRDISVIQVQVSSETLPVAAPFQPSLREAWFTIYTAASGLPGEGDGGGQEHRVLAVSAPAGCLRVPSEGRGPCGHQWYHLWQPMAGYTQASPVVAILTLSSIPSLNRKVKDIQ